MSPSSVGGIAVDSMDEVFLGGTTHSAFFAKLDSGGALKWSTSFPDQTFQESGSVAARTDVFVALDSNSPIDLGEGNMASGPILAKYKP
jgi:hypothetical protein